MSRRLPIVLTAALALALLSAGGAAAAERRTASENVQVTGLQTPTRNIGCLVFGSTLRCDIGQTNVTPPRPPASCHLDWGDAFEMTGRSRAHRLCHGDTALHQGRVVGYGRTWRSGPFTCRVRISGLTCTNRAGHGWFLSKERIILR